jgi:hypothetical protein
VGIHIRDFLDSSIPLAHEYKLFIEREDVRKIIGPDVSFYQDSPGTPQGIYVKILISGIIGLGRKQQVCRVDPIGSTTAAPIPGNRLSYGSGCWVVTWENFRSLQTLKKHTEVHLQDRRIGGFF